MTTNLLEFFGIKPHAPAADGRVNSHNTGEKDNLQLTQAQLDQFTKDVARIHGDSLRLSTVATLLASAIPTLLATNSALTTQVATLKAANPDLDLTGLESELVTLEGTISSMSATAGTLPTSPPPPNSTTGTGTTGTGNAPPAGA